MKIFRSDIAYVYERHDESFFKYITIIMFFFSHDLFTYLKLTYLKAVILPYLLLIMISEFISFDKISHFTVAKNTSSFFILSILLKDIVQWAKYRMFDMQMKNLEPVT